MNIPMWKKALQIIPSVTKAEWDGLDIISKWLISTLAAVLFGIALIAINHWDPVIWLLLGLGSFFVLFYTWPLKYIALGEIAVFLVWGPLMIGGGYYVLAHSWNWNVVWASLPYVLGV